MTIGILAVALAAVAVAVAFTLPAEPAVLTVDEKKASRRRQPNLIAGCSKVGKKVFYFDFLLFQSPRIIDLPFSFWR